MDDMISRQAAIDGIHKAVLEMFDFCDDIIEEPLTYTEETMLEVNKLFTGIIRDLPSAQRWIPVTERLPKNAGTYIICDCYGNVMSRHFCKKADGFAGYWHANGSKYYGNPTHWMPLPEPPKEEP